MIADILLPTFLLVGVGYLVGRFARVPAQPLAQLAFWVLSPALIFESLRTAQLPAAHAVLVAAFTVAHYLGMFALSIPVRRRWFPGDPGAQAAASLVLTFGNCGNLGLPILLFAYGQPGVDVGVVFLATNTVLLTTLGVGLATWEGSFRWRRVVLGLLRVPWPYAVAAAAVARLAGGLPLPLARATGLLAEGAIPLFLVLLGVELAHVRPTQVAGPALALGGLRLLGGGLLAWGLAWAFGTSGTLRASLVVEGSMPTAVNSFLLALQYDRRPDLAASALLLSTLLSVGTISLTLFLLEVVG
ncbi:AEC family transporter [Candidatus Bipolaricaulota bacterium]|nr:AEC family transporter [Candidatus Bipolaricaulota bacterium]